MASIEASSDDTITNENKAEEGERDQDANPTKDDSNGFLSRQVTRSIRLEPPPAIPRPPKVKSESHGFSLLSWLSWNSTEEKDVLYCARSLHQKYSYQSNFRFLGFNMSKNITLQMTEGGVA